MSKKWMKQREKKDGKNLNPRLTPFKTAQGNDPFAKRYSKQERFEERRRLGAQSKKDKPKRRSSEIPKPHPGSKADIQQKGDKQNRKSNETRTNIQAQQTLKKHNKEKKKRGGV